MNRRLLVIAPAICLLLVALTLYFGRDDIGRLPFPAFFPSTHESAPAPADAQWPSSSYHDDLEDDEQEYDDTDYGKHADEQQGHGGDSKGSGGASKGFGTDEDVDQDYSEPYELEGGPDDYDTVDDAVHGAVDDVADDVADDDYPKLNGTVALNSTAGSHTPADSHSPSKVDGIGRSDNSTAKFNSTVGLNSTVYSNATVGPLTSDPPASLTHAEITSYINAIMNPSATHLPRLHCPQPSLTRYERLVNTSASDTEIQFFFALDLRQVVHLLPRLIGSVVEAIRFLGPQRCALSIVEGNSPDGTGEVLAALRPVLDELTTTYYFSTSAIDPLSSERIDALAKLRNMALQPLLLQSEAARYSPESTTVIFLNDVAICLEDILELLYQRKSLSADMVCAMDWSSMGLEPNFYDVWIARGMGGDSFFYVSPDGSWGHALNLFWNHPASKSRLDQHLPFQVYSCWNGATAFTAAPILSREIEFRTTHVEECFQGEPQLFCKDMWLYGYGRIAVIPSINLEYDDKNGKMIKDLKGYVSKWVEDRTEDDEAIDWQREPPEKVLCMPSWDNQYWEPWNVTRENSASLRPEEPEEQEESYEW